MHRACRVLFDCLPPCDAVDKLPHYPANHARERTAMPKRWLRRHLPAPETVRNQSSLHWLRDLLHEGDLWHLNRRSIAGAAFIGVFCAFLPMPFQMLLAALLAIAYKCNLPLSVVLVWISNPLTYIPIFLFNYRVGAWLLEQLIPLWTGSLVTGLVLAAMAFGTVKLGWRLLVQRRWQARKTLRQRPCGADNETPHD